MRISDDGKLDGARQIASENCDARPEGAAIELIVIHNISLPPGEFGGAGIIELFTNRLDPNAHPYYREIAGRKVSSHFLIRRDGAIIQFVRCGQRAWHAGESSWRGRSHCNEFSIGIELEGSDVLPFEDIQYEKLAELTRALKMKYPIADIVGHSDISPGRKTDPGPHFDWMRLQEVKS